MNRILASLLSLLIAALAGCASLSESECRSGDWGGIGYRDGAAGFQRTILDSHDKACAKSGVKPNANAWYAGYERGNAAYCTPQRGLDEGINGASYRGVCPAPLEAAFLERYNVGRQVFQARQTLANIASDIARIDSELARSDLKPERRRELFSQRNYHRVLHIQASQQVMSMEAWARGTTSALPPPPSLPIGR